MEFISEFIVILLSIFRVFSFLFSSEDESASE